MITKQRLSDNASLGDISTNSVCDVAAQVTASSDGSSGDASRNKSASQEALKSDDSSAGGRLLSGDERKVIPGLLAAEDSCNAVDNALRPDLKGNEDSVESDLSFNGKINNLKADKTIAPVAANDSGVVMMVPARKAPECELIDATKGFERADTRKESIERARQERLNKSAELLARENSSWIHYNNEKSPDLFADEDDEDEEYFGRPNDGDTDPDEVDEGVEVRQARSQKLRHSSGVGLPENEQPDDKGDRIDHVERIWLKRLQLSLSGIPPPPSLTFSNMDLDQLLTLYGKRTQQDTKPNCMAPANGVDVVKPSDAPSQTSLGRECLSKPTHSTEQLSSAGWPGLLRCRAHGLHYNKSTVTEKLELLGLKYVERYIGAETSSSFNMSHSPSSAKKRNQRMKMLNQSPGSRLSHLARRRAIFSSANLLNTNKAAGSVSGVASNSTGGNSSKVQILSRLNPFRLCNRQVLIDPKKSDNRRKSKVKTPKRRTPGGVKASPRRRTPGSSAKKRSTVAIASASSSQPLHVPATRESSKRALFLSPQNGDNGFAGATAVVSASRFDSRPVSSSKQQLDRVIFSEARIMRSKRALLFSPQKGDENRSMPSASASFKRARSPEGNDGDCRYQRHHDTGERTEKIRRTECSGLTEDDLTPRSLKFARSKSFCVGAQTSNDASSQTLPECNGKSLFRANSAITSEDGNRPVMVLTENHKKKLLWAVSQALQSKQITVKHESFKQHASILVRVVKKLFLEFNDNSINSTSEKLLRLANKHVFEVIQGKSVDEIYFREKTRILNARNMTKLQGYIGPEEYEMRQLKRTGSLASSLDVPSLDCSATLRRSQSFLSQTSMFSQTSSVFDLSQQSDTGSVRSGMRPAGSTGNVSTTAEGPPVMSSTTALRENINSELRQRSSQKQVSFSGKDSKCVIPYAANDKVPPNNKLLVGGGGGAGAGVSLTSSILKAKRQILFE
ncbi:uncharacterized protein LOC118466284 [Anopheles albimanus]|uniref:Uncharacterized protein n=1 Tax=Anopheles albimanus TaxID=7167 RepID=A0A182FCG0_ANOAL|nr:uncharacterized protein LOC118466284 [Anopheles albimanus]